MSFLSEDQTSEIGNILETGMPVEQAPVPDTSSEQLADVNPDELQLDDNQIEAQTSQQESPTPDTAADIAEESGHRVPYNRFKDVNEAKNRYRNEAKSLKQQLKEAQSQLEQIQSQPKQAPEEESIDDWLGDYQDQESEYDKRFSSLNDRIYEFEVQQAGVTLAQEVAQAQEKYPGVPEQVLYKAVVDDGDANVMEVAEQYYDFIESIQQQAIERYLKDNKLDTPSAAPRPRKSGSSPVNQSQTKKAASPKTMKDAKEALLQHFKDNPIF